MRSRMRARKRLERADAWDVKKQGGGRRDLERGIILFRHTLDRRI